MPVRDENTPRRPVVMAGKMQTKETKAVINRELADSIYARMTCHGHNVYKIARAEGMTMDQVLDHFFDADCRRYQRAIKVAYMNGRRSVLPQVAFPQALRRAA
jgi:cobalamin biosynthesis protein CobT